MGRDSPNPHTLRGLRSGLARSLDPPVYVISRSSVETAQLIKLVLGMGDFFRHILHCVLVKFWYFRLELCPKLWT